jgi:hypothetical protein
MRIFKEEKHLTKQTTTLIILGKDPVPFLIKAGLPDMGLNFGRY